jgi:hypothetical protein
LFVLFAKERKREREREKEREREYSIFGFLSLDAALKFCPGQLWKGNGVIPRHFSPDFFPKIVWDFS